MKTLSLLLLITFCTNAASADERVYELRVYFANEGKLDDLHSRFREHTMGLFKKHGIKNVGYWVPVDNEENKLVYMLSYPDREARNASWKAFMQDEDWKAAYKASIKDGRLVSKIDSMMLKPTDYSPDMMIKKNDEPRVFELRIYNTLDGRMDALNSRFRDHTSKLFNKHGLPQFGYWTPMDEKNGKDKKLVYMLAHKSREDAKTNFAKFGKDPDWQTARKASVKDGPILIKGKERVSSQFLKPTDYSPTR